MWKSDCEAEIIKIEGLLYFAPHQVENPCSVFKLIQKKQLRGEKKSNLLRRDNNGTTLNSPPATRELFTENQKDRVLITRTILCYES